MKILIISDTHGSHKNFDRVIEKERPLDMLIHLGDVEGMRIIFRLLQIVRYIWCVEIMTFSDLPGEEEFMVEDIIYLQRTDTGIMYLWEKRG